MSRIEKLSLVYEFGNFAIDHGATNDKRTCKNLIKDFIENATDNFNYMDDKEELLWFEQSLENIEKAEKYLKEFMEV